MSWFTRMITEGDNATQCPVRVGAVATAAVYHAGAVFMIIAQHVTIDISMLGQYIQHMSTLIGVAGVSIGAKSAMKGDAQ